MPLLLLTHHVIPWVVTKAAEFIRSQLGQSQSPDPTEGLESQTEIQQNAAEQPTSATEGNASEFLVLESDPTQAELDHGLPELRGLEQLGETQRMADQPTSATEGNACQCDMNSFIFPLSDFPPLQREKLQEQKTDVTPGPKMAKISKKNSVRHNVSGSHCTMSDDVKMPVEVRKNRPDPGPNPWAATGPRPWAATGPRPQPVLAKQVSNRENRPVTLKNNHSVKKDLMMQGRKEIQKPAESSKVEKDTEDALTLEGGEMNSSICLSPDIHRLKRDQFEKDMSYGSKMTPISQKRARRSRRTWVTFYDP